MKKIILLLSFCFAFSFSAFADDLKQASESVLACKTVAEAERLACYETAADGLAEVLSVLPEQTIAEAPKPDAQKDEAKDGRFLPSWVSLPGSSEDKKEEPNAYITTVVSASVNNAGRHFVTTEDGTVWRQSEIGRMQEIRNLPAQVEIKKGALGSVRMKFLDSGKRPYRVSAVR